jgi:bifunctional non-homologous end joining protein LigD
VARTHRLEGLVAKRRGSRYEPGRRSSSWLKTALLTTQEVVLGRVTPGTGRRASTLGALLLGAYDDEGRLRFLGHVGTGFTDAVLRDLLDRLPRCAGRGARTTSRSPPSTPGGPTGPSRGWSARCTTAR